MGLKWFKAGDTEPPTGLNLEEKRLYPELATALRSKNEFEPEEWKAFGIEHLRTAHFIKSDNSYFQPVASIADIRQGGKDNVYARTFNLTNAYGSKFISGADKKQTELSVEIRLVGARRHVSGNDAEEVQKINRLYKEKARMEGGRGGFVATFGDKRNFYEGLDAYNGLPSMSGKDLFYLMQDEFLECKDSRIKYITTSNYGGLKTDLPTEWEFATKASRREYPGMTGHTEVDKSTGKPYTGRDPKPLSFFQGLQVATEAKLLLVETLGLRLYTGEQHSRPHALTCLRCAPWVPTEKCCCKRCCKRAHPDPSSREEPMHRLSHCDALLFATKQFIPSSPVP